MLQDIPSDVQRGVKRLLSERGEINLNDFSFSGGGCINLGGKLATNFGDFFLKWNDAARLPLMFQMESSRSAIASPNSCNRYSRSHWLWPGRE